MDYSVPIAHHWTIIMCLIHVLSHYITACISEYFSKQLFMNLDVFFSLPIPEDVRQQPHYLRSYSFCWCDYDALGSYNNVSIQNNMVSCDKFQVTYSSLLIITAIWNVTWSCCNRYLLAFSISLCEDVHHLHMRVSTNPGQFKFQLLHKYFPKHNLNFICI
jgi:hypothetical protein